MNVGAPWVRVKVRTWPVCEEGAAADARVTALPPPVVAEAPGHVRAGGEPTAWRHGGDRRVEPAPVPAHHRPDRRRGRGDPSPGEPSFSRPPRGPLSVNSPPAHRSRVGSRPPGGVPRRSWSWTGASPDSPPLPGSASPSRCSRTRTGHRGPARRTGRRALSARAGVVTFHATPHARAPAPACGVRAAGTRGPSPRRTRPLVADGTARRRWGRGGDAERGTGMPAPGALLSSTDTRRSGHSA